MLLLLKIVNNGAEARSLMLEVRVTDDGGRVTGELGSDDRRLLKVL